MVEDLISNLFSFLNVSTYCTHAVLCNSNANKNRRILLIVPSKIHRTFVRKFVKFLACSLRHFVGRKSDVSSNFRYRTKVRYEKLGKYKIILSATCLIFNSCARHKTRD